MRKLPESIPDDGLLVGWSLEPEYRKPVMGFHTDTRDLASPTTTLEPILDTGEGHLITVAPTGAGKGTGCIIPALLRYPGPVVVVDPKGENYAITANRRREMGHEVILLDPFQITGDPNRHKFNPLDVASPDSDNFIEEISTLSNLISSSAMKGSKDKEVFWVSMGASLISAAMVDVLTMPDSTASSLTAVRDLINTSPAFLAERAQKWRTAENHALRKLAALLDNPAPETIGGYWSFAIQQLDFLKGSLIGDHLSSSDLDLNKIHDGSPLSIYLCLPPDKLESHSALLRLWIGSIIGVITKRKQRPEQSTLLLVDEAAQLGELSQLRQAITLLRGYGVRVWTFWQDLSQLKQIYPYDWETILNNSRIQQFFGATTGMAANVISEVSGYGNASMVMDLEKDEMILNITGDEPVIARKPNYRFDPPFAGKFKENPFYRQITPEAKEEAKTRPVYRKTRAPAIRDRSMKIRQEMILSSRIFHPISQKNWNTLEGDLRKRRLEQIGIKASPFLDHPNITVRRCNLAFYKHYDWYELKDARTAPAYHAYYLLSKNDVVHLNGSSSPIHDTNEKDKIQLTDQSVLLYLEFFCTSVHGDAGRFLIVETVEEIEWKELPEKSYLDELGSQIFPPRIIETNHKEKSTIWVLEAFIVYDEAIFRAKFQIQSEDGTVVMVDESPIVGNLPLIHDLDRLKFIGQFDSEGQFQPLRI